MIGPSVLSSVVDARGRPLRLGRKLGQGGEGSVYELPAETDAVAKIYHQPLSKLRAEKLHAMVGMRTEQIDRLTAWPIEVLSLGTGVPIGVKMPRVVGHKDIHQLYSPKSRRTEFRRADWRFLVRVATNLARAFATVHEASSVIADVNHGGVLVGQDARVRLIDCDSFQVFDGTKNHLCEVGVPTFTPPELQGLVFANIVRTENHDNFGLAILIFLVLFMGRHPFAGRYLGPGDMPIERAIRECRFAYGVRRAAVRMEQPPGTPTLEVVSLPVAQLFERAFARDGRAGGRPTAREWIAALEALEGNVKQCADSPPHWYLSDLQDCPWCRMEAATGVALFSLAISPGAAGYFDFEAFWQQVTALEHPGPVPALDEAVADGKVRPSAAVLEFKRQRWFHGPLALFCAAATMAVGVFVDLPLLGKLFFFVTGFALYFLVRRNLRMKTDLSGFMERERLLRAQWDSVRAEWDAKAGVGAFDAKLGELVELRARWTALPEFRAQRLRDLESNRSERQLSRFLDGFRIQPGEVGGVGTSRKSVLESFGIETAADIHEAKLYMVPGVGAKLRSALVAWRRGLEGRFRFDPDQDGNPPDEDMVEQEVLVERLKLEAAIRKGFADLQQLQKQTLFSRTSLKSKVEETHRAFQQCAADLAAVRR